MANRFLSFFALYFGICFASPLLIMLANRDDIAFGLPWFSIFALMLVLALSSVSYFLSGKTPFAKMIATASLACAIVFMIQANIIHDLFYYGEFNGEPVNWRLYGWRFWLEWVGFLLSFPLFYWLLSKFSKIPVWLTLVPVLSSMLLIAPALLDRQEDAVLSHSDDEVKPEVFGFSSETNLIHLIPDGIQGDIVREVLENQPELAARLNGFTLYRDHLGMYPGTAPSIPAMFTGRPFNLQVGYTDQRIRDAMRTHSYPVHLQDRGYQLDYVTIAELYCVEGASSCVNRPFNDMKPRGYFNYRDDSYTYVFRLLVDLTLFRHSPMFLKETIYNDGKWLFADTTLDGSSPWPDPALREWIANMTVAGPTPRFKSYHYIGTHIPPRWDASCTFSDELERNREQYYNQTQCVLTGIANFTDKLREFDIYDQTAIIVSGDHGIYAEPDDLQGNRANNSLHKKVLGQARPALLIKSLKNREPFHISESPTHLLDIAPTALDLVGLKGEFSGQSALSIEPGSQRPRLFNQYLYDEFWSGEAVSYDSWQVNGPVRDLSNWSLLDVFDIRMAPSKYPAINYNTASRTGRGFSLDRENPNSKASWIGGSEFTILVGTERPTELAKISLSMRLPPFMGDEPQTFSVHVNLRQLEEIHTLHKSKDWLQIDVPVPVGLLQRGNNVVTLKFSQTATKEEYKDWRTAGELESFYLIQ